VDKKGFTLVELLVAIVIVGVLTGLALPNLTKWTQGTKVKKVARQIVTDMQFAKMRAISESVQYRVYFDTTNKQHYIQKGNLSSGSTGWTTVGTVRNLTDAANPYYAKGVTFTDTFTTSCTDCVIFSPTGEATPSGSVTCSASGNTRVVNVTSSGRIRVD
jgi:prepilin-type N-terminal cleavage/methylation domain-containing protein